MGGGRGMRTLPAMKKRALLLVLLLAAPSRPGDDDREFLRAMRGMSFETFLERLPSYGASGGFFPRLFSDELCAGMVIGMLGRFPDRLPDLIPPKVRVQDGFLGSYYLALCLGGGERAVKLLRAVPEKDGMLKELLAHLDEGNELPVLHALDPLDEKQRRVLMGVLLVRTDVGSVVRLATCLADRRDEAADARKRVVEFLTALAAHDDAIRLACRNLRAIAVPAAHADLDAILAKGAK